MEHNTLNEDSVHERYLSAHLLTRASNYSSRSLVKYLYYSLVIFLPHRTGQPVRRIQLPGLATRDRTILSLYTLIGLKSSPISDYFHLYSTIFYLSNESDLNP